MRKKRHEEPEQQTAHDRLELVDLRELDFNQQENLYRAETPTKDITFPYKTERRIVVFVGHDTGFAASDHYGVMVNMCYVQYCQAQTTSPPGLVVWALWAFGWWIRADVRKHLRAG